MILYYMPGTCALGGIILSQWVGAPFQLCRVAREDRQGPVYTTIHPHGKVPAIQTDENRIVTENSAVLLHIAARDPERRFLPEYGTAEFDEQQEWLSYLGSELHAAFYPYFKPHLFVSDEGLHDTMRAGAELQVKKQVAFLDAHLAGRKSMMGEEYGLLDPYVVAMARWGERFLDYAADFPNLHRYLTELRADDAVGFGLTVEAGEITEPSGAAFQGHVPLEARS